MRRATYQLQVARSSLKRVEETGQITPPVSPRTLVYEKEIVEVHTLRPHSEALLQPTSLDILQTPSDDSLMISTLARMNAERAAKRNEEARQAWERRAAQDEALTAKMNGILATVDDQLHQRKRELVNARLDDRRAADRENQNEQRFRQKAQDIAVRAASIAQAKKNEAHRLEELQRLSKQRVQQDVLIMQEESFRHALEASVHTEKMRLYLRAPWKTG